MHSAAQKGDVIKKMFVLGGTTGCSLNIVFFP